LPELLPYTPLLAVMLLLLGMSAFFSCSEAALFSLKQTERAALAEKGKLGKIVCGLMKNPEHLLNSILFANLLVNLLFFTLSSVIVFRIADHPFLSWGIAAGSLLMLILFGEILPKNLAVTMPQFFALLHAVPLAFLVRLLQPILPVLSLLNLLSRRLFCPNFTPEPYLRVGDLERAVALSGNDAALLKREQRVLQNIVSLSDMQAEELMRPRSLLKTFSTPVRFEEVMNALNGTLPRSGYCLLTEPDSDEIVSVLSFLRLTATELETAWNEQFEEIIYVPWSASVAEVFDRLQQAERQVAVVINEFGETIGILSLDDILATVFTREQGRSRRLLDRREVQRISENRWQVTGLTSLRILERRFHVVFTGYTSLTVGGWLREVLERMPRTGDVCRMESLQFTVVSADADNVIVHLQNSP
jgi:CBS domain containing-hemolysin-like protein